MQDNEAHRADPSINEIGSEMTVDRVATLIGVSQATIECLIADGLIQTVEGSDPVRIYWRVAVEWRERLGLARKSPRRKPAAEKSMPQGYITQAEATRRLGLTRQRISQLVNNGKLASTEWNGRLVVNLDSLNDRLDATDADERSSKPKKASGTRGTRFWPANAVFFTPRRSGASSE